MSNRILLADDSLTIQKVVELTFSESGWELMTVGSGDKAIEAYASFRPDVVLADVVMPGLSGYEVCERIKQSEGGALVPVVLLTGTFEPFDRARAERVGCDSIVTKPFDSHALQNMVAELARRAREARAQAATASSVAAAAVATEPEPEPEVQPMAPPPPMPVAAAEPQGDTGEMYATTALRIPTAAELDAFAQKMAADQAAAAPVVSVEPPSAEPEATREPEVAAADAASEAPAPEAAPEAQPEPAAVEAPPVEDPFASTIAVTGFSMSSFRAPEPEPEIEEISSTDGEPMAEAMESAEAEPPVDEPLPEPFVPPSAAEPEILAEAPASEPALAAIIQGPTDKLPVPFEEAEEPEAAPAPVEATLEDLVPEQPTFVEPEAVEPVEAAPVAEAADVAEVANVANVAEVAEAAEAAAPEAPVAAEPEPEPAAMAEIEVEPFTSIAASEPEPAPIPEPFAELEAEAVTQPTARRPVIALGSDDDDGEIPERRDIEEDIAAFESTGPVSRPEIWDRYPQPGDETPEPSPLEDPIESPEPAAVAPGVPPFAPVEAVAELESLAAQASVTDLVELLPHDASEPPLELVEAEIPVATQAYDASPATGPIEPPAAAVIAPAMTAPPLTAAGLSDEDIDRIAKRVVQVLSEKAIRDIAWEVVPELAERLVRARLVEIEGS